MPDPIVDKPKLAPRLEALEAKFEQLLQNDQQLAKGMKRVEKIAEDYHGESLMESCEIAGVKFPGGAASDDDDE